MLRDSGLPYCIVRPADVTAELDCCGSSSRLVLACGDVTPAAAAVSRAQLATMIVASFQLQASLTSLAPATFLPLSFCTISTPPFLSYSSHAVIDFFRQI